MVRVKHVLNWLDDHAPFRLAAGWDRCGLQVGDPMSAVERVLVALDPTLETIREAEQRDCQCLVTHHPLFLKPLDAVRVDRFPGGLIARALRGGISLVVAHTNLDVARAGTNAVLAEMLSLGSLQPLEVDPALRHEELYSGLGRIGLLPRTVPLSDFAEEVRRLAKGIRIRVVGEPFRPVQRVALCTGSGGSLLDLVIREGVDVYVTGDIKYHEAQRALEEGVALVDMGHFASERIVVDPLAEYLRSRASLEHFELEVFTASREEDPFWIL
ncbi:MAG: Nif3-like dinuclear metal center hexameric protein [Syntrophobacteraceae bacterium]|jgi:dinuclear metal center YbgI/SA1388 family protein|nr:Nif3-like dinuclear metal center hexameric protein [Syntrophobacteraceae bacterium]